MKKPITRTVAYLSLFTLFLCTASISAQFKINIPKIPKITRDKPQTPQTTSEDASTASPSSSANPVSTRTSEIRAGIPIPGAKVFFSTTPFTNGNAGAKSTFTSQEFIYGRIELNKSISDTSTITMDKIASKDKKTENSVWGKKSAWCDLSGKIDGKDYGAAILDHPSNPRHPSNWHVRHYGLLSANVFDTPSI